MISSGVPTIHVFGSESSTPAGDARSPRRKPLGRYVTERKAVSLLKAQLALSALAELRAGEREAAAKLLAELVRR